MANTHRICIVDDEPHILSSLEKILESPDREIFLADTAERGWEILKENKGIEVIICDNKLPGMMGIDFLTKVKHLYPDSIRILVTGYPDLNSAMEAINKAHIWRYILKPVDIQDIRILVKQAFEYNRILRENRELLRLARQQAEWLKRLKEKNPVFFDQEVGDNSRHYSFKEDGAPDFMLGFGEQYRREPDNK